ASAILYVQTVMIAVMNLELKIAARRNAQRIAWRPRFGKMTRQVDSGHNVQVAGGCARYATAIGRRATIVDDRRFGPQVQHLSRPVVISVFTLIRLSVLFKMFRDFRLIDHGNSCVMNYAPVAWQHLGSLYPFVLLKIRRDVNIFVIVLRSFGNCE